MIHRKPDQTRFDQNKNRNGSRQRQGRDQQQKQKQRTCEIIRCKAENRRPETGIHRICEIIRPRKHRLIIIVIIDVLPVRVVVKKRPVAERSNAEKDHYAKQHQKRNQERGNIQAGGPSHEKPGNLRKIRKSTALWMTVPCAEPNTRRNTINGYNKYIRLSGYAQRII